MSLAYYASPIDFQQNELMEQKRKDSQKNKLNLNVLKQIAQPKEEEIKDIHNNMGQELKDENDQILADFYENEVKTDLKTSIQENQFVQDTYHNENVKTDYLISNNENANKVSNSYSSSNNEILLQKLNHIIDMFEEQKDIRTNQKNEETVLYCFLGIFVIYVLDSFVSIGKYKHG